MIAYNSDWLKNLVIRNESESVFHEQCMLKEELDAVCKKYQVGFYTPNIFIAIGLFILTLIILLLSFGLFALMLMSASEKSYSYLAIVFAVACYAVLELMISKKRHYQSGVDTGLLWVASLALFAGISLLNDFGNIANGILVFMISLAGVIRYADRLLAVCMYFSFLSVLFFSCMQLGTTAKALVPFVIIIVSWAFFYFIMQYKNRENIFQYKNCMTLIEISSLISLYAAGNYFIVSELSNDMFNLQLQPGETIPFGWIYWIFTVLVPPVYLLVGIRKKNMILVRTGLILLAAIVFTVRYYHSILPVEYVMSMAGIIILPAAYLLLKRLQEPVYGFTSKKLTSKNEIDKLQLESLLLAQTFKPGIDQDVTKFGGGSFGGGGASADY